MAQYYRLERDGIVSYHEVTPDTPAPEGSIVVDRLPSAFEDRVDNKWVKDHKAAADASVPLDHIKEVHLMKYTEALLIKSGVDLKVGLLVEEAAFKGTPIQTLANQVIQKRKAVVDLELRRQKLQAGEVV